MKFVKRSHIFIHSNIKLNKQLRRSVCFDIWAYLIMTTSGKPLLPSLQSIFHTEGPMPEPCSSLLNSMRPRFYSDNGVIRLPPLEGGVQRPKSVDSGLRHTMVSQPANTETKVEPSTPLSKTKSATSSLGASSSLGKRCDVLTPLSAARAIITPSANDKKRAFAFITHSQETFPKKEPKIDNAPLARRKRRRTSTQELRILQAEFDLCPAPDKRKRQELADRCNMSVKAIQIWFQNRRQASKKQKNSASKSTAASAETKEMSEMIIEDNLHMTPLANKIINTLETGNCRDSTVDDLSVVLPEEKISPTKSINKYTPTKLWPSSKRGQALTFHLTSDKKLLTPIKTPSNTRVNRLINGTPGSVSPFPRKYSITQNNSKPILEHKKIPLRELNTNTLVH